MSKVPITMIGYHCDWCGHEWVPRDYQREPKVCPKCKNAYWNRPRQQKAIYDEFRATIHKVLAEAGKPLSWTEIRTAAGLAQLFPNNRWVRRLEADISLKRVRDHRGIIQWYLEAGGRAVDEVQSSAPTQRVRTNPA